MNPFDFIGPGTLKGGLEILNKCGVPCEGAVDALRELTSSPGYMKYRIDEAQDKISDFWDDHKDEVSDFLEDAGDAISDAWDSIAENAGDILGSIFS